MRKVTIMSIASFVVMTLVCLNLASITLAQTEIVEENKVINTICPVMGG